MDIKSFCAKAERASKLMKNLSNPYRLMILCRLQEKECSVGELGELIPLSQSSLSQHLARLRKCGIVKTRRESQTIYYRLVDDKASKVIKELYTIFCR